MRRLYRFYGSLALLASTAGCATSGAVRTSKDLPVRSIVLYRSGVGYFEREGSFKGSALTFAVKQDEVGDFLSSLTAIEQGGGEVSSIAFDIPEDERAAKPAAPACEGEDCEPTPESSEPARVDVRLMLSKPGTHALHVAYVIGSPIWRPSYRIVLDEQKDALLQAWAVVQNTSGEDWKDVRLALTTGAPISFRSDLATPITPQRPLVTDTGEVVQHVPTAEVTLDQEGAGPEAMALAADAAEEEAQDESVREMAPSRAASKSLRLEAQANRAMPAPPASKIEAADLERSVSSQATHAALPDNVTRYDLKGRVNVPDGGSTMVAILSERVPGEKAHLFAPEPGVALSFQHPFSVVRLQNKTSAVLEKGPVAVLGSGAFLGQGVLDTLPQSANAFVPFAVDKSLVVEPHRSFSQQQGSLVRIRRGVITVEQFSQRETRYQARNGGDQATKVYVRHPRWGQAELFEPPEGTELSPGRALIPLNIAAHASADLKVIERTPVQRNYSILQQPAADAIALWLTGPAADAKESQALKRALELRSELVKVQDETQKLEREQSELARSAEETRQNLKSIQKVKRADDLRQRLVARLNEVDARLGELTRALVESRTRESELEVRLSEALESVTLDAKGKPEANAKR